MKKIDYAQLEQFLSQCGPNTKIYLGCDSEKIKFNGKWFADYVTVIVVHIESSKGCKIFGQVEREPDYDKDIKKPRMRLLNEAIKVASLYNEFKDLFTAYEVEIHLDINPNKKFNSSIVIQEAIGYIRGMTGLEPIVKNDAWAASFAADRYKEIANM